jgi:synaptojanin
MWEVQVQKTLNEQRPKGDYILLRSGQLVGTALMLFVKSSKIPYVKRVDGAIKKVALSQVITDADGSERNGRK